MSPFVRSFTPLVPPGARVAIALAIGASAAGFACGSSPIASDPGTVTEVGDAGSDARAVTTSDDAGSDAATVDPGYYDVRECEEADGQAPASILVIDGEINDPLYLAADHEVFTTADGWQPYGPGLGAEVGLATRPAGYQYVVWFMTADGGTPSAGIYSSANSTDDDASVSDDGGVGIYVNEAPLARRVDLECGYMTGSFYVKDVEWSADHTAVRSFLATFVRRCNGQGAEVRGCIHYVAN
jgi:hypothetical protein